MFPIKRKKKLYEMKATIACNAVTMNPVKRGSIVHVSIDLSSHKAHLNMLIRWARWLKNTNKLLTLTLKT